MLNPHANEKLRRWFRRSIIVVLVGMLSVIFGSLSLAVWAVAVTYPVVVVDGQNRPVSDAVVFDFDKAVVNRQHASLSLGGGGLAFGGGFGCGTCCFGSPKRKAPEPTGAMGSPIGIESGSMRSVSLFAI